MANGHGGRRAGAGKKPRAEKFARPIAQAEKRIADRLPELIDSLFEQAAGLQVREVDHTGKEKIYDRPPDFRAASYLVDRILGKPPQSVEGEITQDGRLRIIIEYANRADRPADAAPEPGEDPE